jgi:hypothetical protein
LVLPRPKRKLLGKANAGRSGGGTTYLCHRISQMRAFDRDPIPESITASGHESRITRQEKHGCTNQPRITAKKTLAKAEPFTQSERYTTMQVAAQSTGYPYGNRNDGELKGPAVDVGIWHFSADLVPAGEVSYPR